MSAARRSQVSPQSCYMFFPSTINRSKTSKRQHNYKQHQNMKHSNGKLVKPPEMKQQRNGSQILVPDNNDSDNAYYVTIHVYHIGVVLIQGRDCATWEVDDMPDIKSLLPNVLPKPCQFDTSVINSPCQPVSVSPIRPDDSIKSSRPRTLVSRLYQAASLIIPSSFNYITTSSEPWPLARPLIGSELGL